MINDIAYCGMRADVLQVGHINLLWAASRLGCRVMVGLLTDEAMSSCGVPPSVSYAHRKILVGSLRLVDEVVPQYSLDYEENLLRYRPRHLVHGGEWSSGVREAAVRALGSYGGSLVEVPFENLFNGGAA